MEILLAWIFTCHSDCFNRPTCYRSARTHWNLYTHRVKEQTATSDREQNHKRNTSYPTYRQTWWLNSRSLEHIQLYSNANNKLSDPDFIRIITGTDITGLSETHSQDDDVIYVKVSTIHQFSRSLLKGKFICK